MKKSSTLLFIFLVSSFVSFSQLINLGKNNQNFQVNNEHKCGFDKRHTNLLQNDPSYNQKRIIEEQHFQDFLNLPYVEKAVKTIPVVVHVIHLGEAVGTGTNISDAQIMSAINNLNDAYSNNGYTGVDTEIQFCLAQRDESGNPSTGIVRVDGSGLSGYSTGGIGTGGAAEVDVKALSKWDNTKYYNFWIVTEIDNNNAGGGTQGYAYFPGAGATVDGAVIMYNSFGYDPTELLGYNLKSYTNRNVTTIHEIGHGFNLYHTFQGDGTGTTCPSDSDCGTNGDCVGDTPPHKRSTSNCDINTTDATCNNVDKDLYVHNFMDYSSDACQTEFTAGQSTRMNATLNFGGGRYSLTQSDGCVPADNAIDASITAIVSPVSSYCQTTFSPQVTLRNFGSTTLTAVTILYNIDGGANETYNWTGSLTTGSSENVTLNEVSTTIGSHTFAVYTDNPNGTVDEYTANDDADIAFTITTSNSLPFTEDFEGSFPPTDWTIGSGDVADASAWDADGKKALEKKAVTSESDGTAGSAMAINGYAYQTSSGDRTHDITTPAINLSGTASPLLRFQVAHAYYNTTSNTEKLKVFVSNDCGVTYTQVYSKSDATLATVGQSGAAFMPDTDADWRQESIDLTAYVGDVVQVKFETESNYGNNLFIDKINIFDNCTTPTVLSSTPSSRCGTGDVTISATPSAGTIKWYDAAVAGNLLYSGSSFLISGLNSTTNYYAEATNGSCVSASRELVVATISSNCSQVLASQCGTTLAGLRTAISADKVPGATRYRFELTEGVNTHVVTTVNRWIFLDQFNYKNATSYSIRVATEIGGIFGGYGDACTVTTAHPSTKVWATQCGTTLASVSTAISADQVKGATAYKFRITDGTNTYYVERANRWFYLSDFNYKLNQEYTIDVASNLGTGFSAYGSPCTITTPIPATKVQVSQCGTTLATNSTAISADQVKGASFYKFKITNGATVQYVTLTVRWMYLYHITYTPGTSYSIEVQAMVNGAWGPYGAACTITTPGSGMIQNPNEEVLSKFETVELNAYPNPSNGEFTISSSHEGTFNIINELGQLVQTVEITEENNFMVQVGIGRDNAPLHPGMYFISGTINNEVVTTKILVQ